MAGIWQAFNSLDCTYGVLADCVYQLVSMLRKTVVLEECFRFSNRGKRLESSTGELFHLHLACWPRAVDTGNEPTSNGIHLFRSLIRGDEYPVAVSLLLLLHLRIRAGTQNSCRVQERKTAAAGS